MPDYRYGFNSNVAAKCEYLKWFLLIFKLSWNREYCVNFINERV